MAIILGETGRSDVCLQLGKQGEHDVTFFEFDFSLWAAKYGDGVLSLRLTPNGSATAYPVTLDFDGTIATFTVTATDTATAGLGSAELVYIVGDDEKLKKSVSYVTSVEPSDDTGEAPEPYDEWLAHLEVLAGETSQAKTDAETAASNASASEQAAAQSESNAKTSEENAEEYADRIADLTVSAHEATGETPTVIKTIVNDVYNLDFGLVPGKDGEDGKDGQDGADGVGIASVALNSDYTLTITLTDGRTYTTTSIRGEQGETGLTPDFTIGTVTTLAPGSQATATITGTDEDPVLNLGIPKGDPGDVSSTGYYPDLYAGGLVTDKGETDTAPYVFRASKALGYRESLNQIVGATVGWNQILPNPTTSQTINGITFTVNADGSVTMNGTATADAKFYYSPRIDYLKDHVYLVTGVPVGGSETTYRALVTTWNYTDGIKKFTANDYYGARVEVYSGVTVNNVKFALQCFDLTAAFGVPIADYVYNLETATAGSGVAWLKAHFPKMFDQYHAYCQPRLESVRVSGHECVGFNQWDEEWENALWTDLNVGRNPHKSATSGNICCKNPIPVLPNTTYFLNCGKFPNLGTAYADAALLDENMKFIAYYPPYGYLGRATKEIVTTSETRYVIFNMYGAYGASYLNDICLNISDPNRNGTYLPYEKHTYPLDSSLTLNGILKLSGDEITADGDVYPPSGGVSRRYAMVDLGTLTWVYDGDEIFRTSLIPAKFMGLGICSKYQVIQVGSWSQVGDKQMSVTNSQDSPILRIHDSSMGTDAAAFKSAMSGVYLVYELATPTTETADPYQQIQVCDPDGTEQFTDYGVESGDRDVAIPCGHETFYPEDLKGKLEDIPDIPEAPASNGTYTLKAVRSNSGVTYQWVSG